MLPLVARLISVVVGTAERRTNLKGRDIGYALAANSCEGVNDVEHAPSQPLMRSLLSQFQTPMAPRSTIGFFGSGCPADHSAGLITQPTSDWRPMIAANPFSHRRGGRLDTAIFAVNAHFLCNCGKSCRSVRRHSIWYLIRIGSRKPRDTRVNLPVSQEKAHLLRSDGLVGVLSLY
jgi:hypothetical protein